jgi:glycosyltransferase involved in cell wall biosynthesis
MWFAISPRLVALSEEAGLPQERMRVIPNGVDIVRFRPPAPGERSAIRQALGWTATGPIVLFVGFFSREKRPDLLFEAWASLAHAVPDTMLVFVGATLSGYHEIDGALVGDLHRRASALDVKARILYIERTHEIELFYRAIDIYVLPSVREGLPNALLEAMASGAACVATRLPGVTEGLIDDGRNGLLVAPDQREALETALRGLASNPDERARLGAEARRTIESHYGIERVAVRYLEAYAELLGHPACAR